MKKQKRVSAVVLGAGVNGLGQVRSLGNIGIYPHLIHSDDPLENLATFSKYCIPIHVPKDTLAYETELERILVDLVGASKEKPLLYAASDYFVNYIARHRDILKEYYLFNMPDNRIIDIITNKYKTDSAARKAGLKSPKTIRLTEIDSAISFWESVGFPCILKPQDSYSCDFPGKNLIIKDERELIAFNSTYPKLKDQVILQELIPGDEKNIYQCTAYVGKYGLMQFFTMQKIHQYPPGYGITSFGRSTIIPELIEGTKAVLMDVGYTGFASVEFKKSDKDRQYYLIEINPRLPWYNALFLSCGVNFPYLAYLDLKQSASIPTSSTRQADNVYWIHMKNEIAALRNKNKTDVIIDIFEYIKDISRVRSFAYFDPYDLYPFYRACIYFATRLLPSPLAEKGFERNPSSR